MEVKNNVKLWFALDKYKNKINIEDAENGVDYYCPGCGSIVRGRAKDSSYVTSHFYHVNNSNCNVESFIHNYWKNNLINIGDTFSVNKKIYRCKDKRVEFCFTTKFGEYRPDLVVKTEENEFIIFEIYNTNKKNIEEYISIWNSLKYKIIEVDVKNIDRKNKPNDFLTLFDIKNIDDILNNLSKKQLRGLNYLKLFPETKQQINFDGTREHCEELFEMGLLDKEDLEKMISEKRKLERELLFEDNDIVGKYFDLKNVGKDELLKSYIIKNKDIRIINKYISKIKQTNNKYILYKNVDVNKILKQYINDINNIKWNTNYGKEHGLDLIDFIINIIK